MPDATELRNLDERAKQYFEVGRYQEAADAFRAAADGYAELGDALNTAEQKNNLSVTLLKLRRAQDALDQAAGTDAVFAAAGDTRRQGMALNNQAVALEELGRNDEALAAYERSAQALSEAGEGDLRAEVLKSAAAIELRRGKIGGSGLKMVGALEATGKPTWWQRVLRAVLRLTR